MLFCTNGRFFFKKLFQINLSGIPSECQKFRSRTDKTVCKVYQQKTLVGNEFFSSLLGLLVAIDHLQPMANIVLVHFILKNNITTCVIARMKGDISCLRAIKGIFSFQSPLILIAVFFTSDLAQMNGHTMLGHKTKIVSAHIKIVPSTYV